MLAGLHRPSLGAPRAPPPSPPADRRHPEAPAPSVALALGSAAAAGPASPPRGHLPAPHGGDGRAGRPRAAPRPRSPAPPPAPGAAARSRDMKGRKLPGKTLVPRTRPASSSKIKKRAFAGRWGGSCRGWGGSWGHGLRGRRRRRSFVSTAPRAPRPGPQLPPPRPRARLPPPGSERRGLGQHRPRRPAVGGEPRPPSPAPPPIARSRRPAPGAADPARPGDRRGCGARGARGSRQSRGARSSSRDKAGPALRAQPRGARRLRSSEPTIPASPWRRKGATSSSELTFVPPGVPRARGGWSGEHPPVSSPEGTDRKPLPGDRALRLPSGRCQGPPGQRHPRTPGLPARKPLAHPCVKTESIC